MVIHKNGCELSRYMLLHTCILVGGNAAVYVSTIIVGS